MNKSLLFLSAATSLLVASCNRDKQAAVDAATTPSADTAVVVRDEAMTTDATATADGDTAAYRTEADRLADRIAQDLRLTDTVVVTRVEKTYYTRGRRLNEVNTRYTTDTTGRYAALRQVNDDTDREVRTYITDPAQYRTYQENRNSYYAGTPYSNATITTTTEREETPARRRGPSIVKYDKKANGETKIVYSNGKTVKIDKDGDTKVEYRNGTKVKRDADDGEVKVKR
ncbi:T-complex 10 C-terminal domain-containing protein [Hymenobacter sublimis]|uniref:T-complex 10 C-terminal domain-containing protein n=1 Tax=Hymenobacter sublimis TaxID=2933777 RepID=A0ABY4J7D9_9BACT|nr:T-complex 10 C-terminal domain-containing protein [Hymenobacter sublimis]UPL48742.1 T-complex 10 C-terminal domain-containing protein [Hymenobacter sublimis]